MAANASMQTGGNFLFNAGFGSMGQVIPVQYLPLPMVSLSLSPHVNQFVQAPGAQNLVAGNENWDGGLLHNGRNQIHNQGIVDKPLINDANQNAMLDPHSTKLQQPQVGLLSSKSQVTVSNTGLRLLGSIGALFIFLLGLLYVLTWLCQLISHLCKSMLALDFMLNSQSSLTSTTLYVLNGF